MLSNCQRNSIIEDYFNSESNDEEFFDRIFVPKRSSNHKKILDDINDPYFCKF